MNINNLDNYTCQILDDKTLDIYDIPGQGFFKQKIIELIPSAIAITIFLDSTDK